MDARVSSRAPIASANFTPDDWSKAFRNSHFENLVRFKTNRVRPAVFVYFLTYVMLSVLAGFAPNVMAIKLIGSFTLGYAFLLFTYLTAWAVALWYVKVADVEFDPLKRRAIESIEMEGSAS